MSGKKGCWLAFLALPIAVSFLWAGSFAADATVGSAYGALRYAQNIVAGRGLAHDAAVGGMVLPLTSPLFVLFLTIGSALGVPLHWAALFLSGLGWGLTAVTVYLLGMRWGRPSTGILSACLLVISPIIPFTLGAPLSWAAGLAWLALLLSDNQDLRGFLPEKREATHLKNLAGLQEGRWGQTAVLALLLLSNFDLATILLVILLWATQPRENRLLRGLPLLALIAGLGGATWRLGLPIALFEPNWGQWLSAGRELLQENELYWLFAPFVGLGLIAVSRIDKSARRPLILLLLWPLAAVISGSEAVWGGTAVAAIFLVGLGVEWLADWLNKRKLVQLSRLQLAVGLAIIAGLSLGGAQSVTLWREYRIQPRLRRQLEAQAADWLRRHSSETATIFASKNVGYLADRPLWPADDELSDVAELPLLFNELVPHPPNYFVTSRTVGWTYVTHTSWFTERYQPARQIPSDYDPGAPLIVWERRLTPFDRGDSTPINVVTKESLDLIGYRVWPRRIEPGDAVHVQLDWQANRPFTQTLKTVVRVAATSDRIAWAQRDMDTPRSLPADWIQSGAPLSERFTLTTTLDIPTGSYLVTVSLYPPRTEIFSTMYQDGDSNPLDRVTLGYVTVPWQGEIGSTAVPLNAPFGDQIRLLSYEQMGTAVPGETITLRLYWEAMRAADDNYTVFIHLLDDAGQYIAGHDGPPFNGRYETASWQPGDIIPDDHPLTLPPDLPPGVYAIRIGLYQSESGVRLPAADAQGNLSPDQAFLLPPLTVGER
ncbi:MAG: hypothetical protein GY803_23560 [Chloroflexi bacterium]|nr:hypothetical protein [Chloroflexota bacterium]